MLLPQINMYFPITTITKEKYPYLLKKVSALPKYMYVRGTLPPDNHKFLCVIGARNFTSYGKEVCTHLIAGLKGYPIVIVSGLAIGIDSIAHEAAIEHGLKAIAFPGSGLSDHTIYPSSRRALANKILNSGGSLVSPFDVSQTGTEWTFPARNRLMAGISHATLIIEAKKKSGTLITAEFAGDFGRDLLVVPNSILTETSEGSNELLREGAIAVTSPEHILEALGIETQTQTQQLFNILENTLFSPEEKLIIECLRHQPYTSTDLIEKTHLSVSAFNVVVTELELKELISERGGFYHLGLSRPS
jgi:DNA processing protein